MHLIIIKQIEGREIIELSNEIIEAKISVKQGFNLYSLLFNETETIYFNEDLETYSQHKKLAGIPFMHPWSNRLNGDKILNRSLTINEKQKTIIYRDANHLPLHGLILKSDKWKITSTKATESEASCTAKYSFDDKNLLAIFPFLHDVFLTIKLQGNSIFYTVEINNKSNKAMPVCFGFHPYFSLKNSSQIYLVTPGAAIAEVDNVLLPTQNFIEKDTLFPFQNDILDIKNQQIDHAFIHHNQDKKYRLITDNYVVEFDLDKHYRVMQIYHPDKAEKPYICIEPMTALADALNHGNYAAIPAGKKFEATFSMKFKK